MLSTHEDRHVVDISVTVFYPHMPIGMLLSTHADKHVMHISFTVFLSAAYFVTDISGVG